MMHNPDRPFPQLDELEHRTLALLTAGGLTQVEIAAKLATSQPTVSRIIKKHRKSLGLEERWVIPGLSRQQQQALSRLRKEILGHVDEEISLTERLQAVQVPPEGKDAPLQRVHIAHSDGHGKRDVALAAAELVTLLLLNKPEVVGITWGKTPQLIVERLRILNEGQLDTPPTVFPAAGEVLLRDSRREIGQSASVIAAALASIWGSPEPISLAGVPAFLDSVLDLKLYSGAYLDDNDRILLFRQFFEEQEGYRQIFGVGKLDSSALIARADGIICGMGALGEDLSSCSPTLGARLKKEELKPLSKYIAGDIGGVFLSQPDVSDEEFDRHVKARNKACLGIRFRHFRRIARCQKMGVIAVANGKLKAKVALTAVKKCCVRHLVIDLDLARELHKLLD